MIEHRIAFQRHGEAGPVIASVPTGTLLTEAARLAGVELGQPCGGQGRCGRCLVQVTGGAVRRRSTLRLTPRDVDQGYALACQAVVEGDVTVAVPPQTRAGRCAGPFRPAARH